MQPVCLQFALLGLLDVGDAVSEGDFARAQVLHLERDLGRAVGSWADFPDLGLQSVSRPDRGGEATAVQSNRLWITAANCVNDRAYSEAIGRQTVEDHATEASSLANSGINVERIIISTETEDNCLLWRGLVLESPVRLAVFRNGLFLRRTSNYLLEVRSIRFSSQVERRAIELGVWCAVTVDQGLLREEEDTALVFGDPCVPALQLPARTADQRQRLQDLDVLRCVDHTVWVERR